MRFVALAFYLSISMGRELQAQVIAKVALSIDDGSGQFSSAFAAAFRQLGDVQVVSKVDESTDYVLDGVVMCRPDCLSAASYSAALRLYAPFDRSSASTAASLTLYHFRASLPEADRRACGWFERQIRSTSCDAAASARRDSAEQLIYATLRLYERTVDTWVVEWGRQTYEQAIREFVRAIDVRCFEPKRRVQRAVTNGDTVALRRAQTDPSGFHCR